MFRGSGVMAYKTVGNCKQGSISNMLFQAIYHQAEIELIHYAYSQFQ